MHYLCIAAAVQIQCTVHFAVGRSQRLVSVPVVVPVSVAGASVSGWCQCQWLVPVHCSVWQLELWGLASGKHG